jgi:hypothetical protein
MTNSVNAICTVPCIRGTLRARLDLFHIQICDRLPPYFYGAGFLHLADTDRRYSPQRKNQHAQIRDHGHQGSQAFSQQAIEGRKRSVLAGRNDNCGPGAIRVGAQGERPGTLDHHHRPKNACGQAARYASYAPRFLLNSAERRRIRNRASRQERSGSARSHSSRRAFSYNGAMILNGARADSELTARLLSTLRTLTTEHMRSRRSEARAPEVEWRLQSATRSYFLGPKKIGQAIGQQPVKRGSGPS